MTRSLMQDKIYRRLEREFLGSRLIDNSLRGYWCEAMLAEALGSCFKIVSHGWHPWDLQFGADDANYPNRIRIQVKNAAAAQTWHKQGSAPSSPLFSLKYRKRPRHFEHSQAEVPCEKAGFLCEVFALCYHPKDIHQADHRIPEQWLVYLLPIVGPNCAITGTEIAYLRQKTLESGKPSQTQRAPGTLEKGIRGRPPIKPIPAHELSSGNLFECLGLSRS